MVDHVYHSPEKIHIEIIYPFYECATREGFENLGIYRASIQNPMAN